MATGLQANRYSSVRPHFAGIGSQLASATGLANVRRRAPQHPVVQHEYNQTGCMLTGRPHDKPTTLRSRGPAPSAIEQEKVYFIKFRTR